MLNSHYVNLRSKFQILGGVVIFLTLKEAAIFYYNKDSKLYGEREQKLHRVPTALGSIASRFGSSTNGWITGPCGLSVTSHPLFMQFTLRAKINIKINKPFLIFNQEKVSNNYF